MKKLFLLLINIIAITTYGQVEDLVPPIDKSKYVEISKDYIPNKEKYYSRNIHSAYEGAFLKGMNINDSRLELDKIVFNKVYKNACNDGKIHTLDDRTFVIIYINRRGKVTKVELPFPEDIEEKCQRAIIEAILPLRFIPAKINGYKVNSFYEQKVNFRLSKYNEWMIN